MKTLYALCVSVTDSQENAAYVFSESLLYLVGVTGAFEFQRLVKPYCISVSAKKFRLRLRADNYTNLRLKLFVLSMFLEGGSLKARAKVYDVAKQDALLIRSLVDENVWFRKLVKAYVAKHTFHADDLRLPNIERRFNQVYDAVLKYVKYITYHKLRFLVKVSNSDYSDYHSELMAKIVQAFHAVVPTNMSDLHLQNYLKRIVHNHAINMIKSETSQKCGRMVSSMDEAGHRQFTVLCVSQNQAALDSNGDLMDVDGRDDSSEQFELRFSITEVLDRVGASSSEYRFLTLLLGFEDVEFTKWLRLRGVCTSSTDNVDVQNTTTPQHYTQLVSDFLRFSKESTAEFLSTIRLQMAWG